MKTNNVKVICWLIIFLFLSFYFFSYRLIELFLQIILLGNFYREWIICDKFESLIYGRCILKKFQGFNFLRVFAMIMKEEWWRVCMLIIKVIFIMILFFIVIVWAQVEVGLFWCLFYFLIGNFIVFYNLSSLDFLYHIVIFVEH